ncbi:MAG: PASTA domain-containing protein [Bryobacterales bacterium]
MLADRDGAILVSGEAPPVSSLGEEPAESEAKPKGRKARIRVAAVETPDFSGMTVREAIAEAAQRGLELEMNGAGLALRQDPPAGTPIQSGAIVRITFGRMVASAGARR